MTEKEREQMALFRYGLIAPILNNQVESRKDYLAEICSRIHQVPCYGPKEYTPKTVECWLLAYRRYGFDGLKPKPRSDHGQFRAISSELKEKVLDLRREKMNLSVTLFREQMILNGDILPSDMSYSTLYRFLKKEGLTGKEKRRDPDRKRFCYDKVNMLWQGDLAVGPYLKAEGKKTRTYLFAFIDDCSRLVPYAEFVTTEKFGALKNVFSEALLKRGIPKMLYVDNGKIYRSDQLQLACASLGITLIHTKPYDPASKGKIERFFRTVRQRFFVQLTDETLSSLDNLNIFFLKWLETDYNRRFHSAVEMPPLDKFMSQASEVKTVNDPNLLEEIFLKKEYRRVKHDGTISVKNKLFEVSAPLIGQRIEVRFNPDIPEEVFVYKEGKLLEQAKPVNFSDNAKVKRDKDVSSNLSFHSLTDKGVEENV